MEPCPLLATVVKIGNSLGELSTGACLLSDTRVAENSKDTR